MASALSSLLKHIELPWVVEGARIGIKLHWGEPGNITFLPPDYARSVAGDISRRGARPYICDTTTLYRGQRRNALDNLWVAHQHGFGYDSTGAPVLIADGVTGTDVISILVPGEPLHQQTVKVASVIDQLDGIITLSHFKGHLASGFGGVLKNLAMGFASRATKQIMHADVTPELNEDKCTGCAVCAEVCPADAVKMKNERPVFNLERCIGCAECIAMCHDGALRILWNASSSTFVEKLAETAAAVCDRIGDRMLHIQVIANVTSECDCMKRKMKPIVPDCGIIVSTDPVALDSAACDIVNNVKPLPDAGISPKDGDIIKALYPEVPYRRQLEYAELLGMGSVRYELIEVNK